MKIIRLRILDFDNLENSEHKAEYISLEKYFINEIAHNNFVINNSKLNRNGYKTWNGVIYPKHIVDEIEVIES